MGELTEKWGAVCEWLRSQPEGVLDGSETARGVAFGVLFPGLWRGKSNFSPIRAELLKKLLGEKDWYERIYRDPKAIWLTPARFDQWRQQPSVATGIAANLSFWTNNSRLAGNLSAVGWAKLLQTAYDFRLLDSFQALWQRALRHPWSADELALLYSVY